MPGGTPDGLGKATVDGTRSKAEPQGLAVKVAVQRHGGAARKPALRLVEFLASAVIGKQSAVIGRASLRVPPPRRKRLMAVLTEAQVCTRIGD